MKFSDLISEYYESEALKIYFRLKVLDASYYVFEQNYGELMELLTKIREPANYEKLWNDKKGLDMHLLELTRLLHNLVASVMSLVEHTRIIINAHYKGTNFYDEYEKEKKNRFVNNRITGFVQELRNYTLHYGLPFATANLGLEVDPGTQETTFTNPITLDKARLLEWGGWTQKKGKPYLDAADDHIEIQIIMEEYSQAARDFQQWMWNRLQDIHADELKWLEKTKREIRKALGDLPRPT